MSEIPSADAGLGSGIVNVSQQVAAAVGLAVLSTVADQPHQVVGRPRPSGCRGALAGLPVGASHRRGMRPGRSRRLAPFLLRTNESPEERAAHMAENMENPEAYEHLVL